MSTTICMVLESSYPYKTGGVSAWTHSVIKLFPDYDFKLLTLLPNRKESRKFEYKLPENVVSVHELYLNDRDWGSQKLPEPDRLRGLLRSLFDQNERTDWNGLFDYFSTPNLSIDTVLTSEVFLDSVSTVFGGSSRSGFGEILWTIRSICYPLFLSLAMEIPEADLYHTVSTGYAGIIGCKAKWKYQRPLILSEHGLYTREREEELIETSQVPGKNKNIWISFFREMSRIAYEMADEVVSLFAYARKQQIELGCRPEKAIVVPNGINVNQFTKAAAEAEERRGRAEKVVNVGACLRIAPIKDVKTMLYAFAEAKKKVPELVLYIMGPESENRKYSEECRRLVKYLALTDVIFTGTVETAEYLGRMDIGILTSISEGQPLVILEFFASRCPVVATDVGNCRGLIEGEEGDAYGPAGIVTGVMDTHAIASALIALAKDRDMRLSYGDAGFLRVNQKYRFEQMGDRYREIYEKMSHMHMI